MSSIGRIKRHERISFSDTRGWHRPIKMKILKLKPNRRGYIRVHLSIKNIKFQVSAHRLVALSFIPNPDNKPHINHKNGVKDDNRIENLEWVTCSENNFHAHRTGLAPKKRPNGGLKGLRNPNAKKVQFLPTGAIMSMSEGADFIDIDRSHFMEMMHGKFKNWSGFVFY